MPNPRERPGPAIPRKEKQADKSPDWYVSIPFSDLHKLMNEVQLLEEMKNENAKLRRELDGLRNMFSELQTTFGELKRELKGR